MKSFGLFLLCAVCSAFVSARAAAQPPRSQSAAELTGAAAGPQYAGRPLRFWIEQSKASDRADARKAVEALVLALEGASLADMVAAADALEAMGPEARAAAPALARKLDHKQPWVRIASMNALKAIGPEAVPWVVEVYEKGSPAARQRAASVLGAMGPKARSALPALRKSLGRASPGERAQIEEVLAQIGERGDGPGPSQEAARPDAAGLSRSEGLPRGEADSDWPQFHGPRRDSICRETGLLTTWPAGGPKLLWKREGMGRAYSSVSIARGRLFTMGDRRDGPGESQFVIALDLATQKDLWATRIGPPHDDGPRCTPTVDGDRVYALGTEGDLLCLDAATGKVLWRMQNMPFGGHTAEAATRLGIPTVLPEIGSHCSRLHDRQANVSKCATGITNVMKLLGMLEGRVRTPKDQMDQEMHYIHCEAGGIHTPLKQPLEKVTAGETLAVITDVFGKPVSQVKAPFDGIVIGYWSVPVIRPGDWSYMVGKIVD